MVVDVIVYGNDDCKSISSYVPTLISWISEWKVHTNTKWWWRPSMYGRWFSFSILHLTKSMQKRNSCLLFIEKCPYFISHTNYPVNREDLDTRHRFHKHIFQKTIHIHKLYSNGVHVFQYTPLFGILYFYQFELMYVCTGCHIHGFYYLYILHREQRIHSISLLHQ